MDKKKVNDRVIIAINILLKRCPDLSKATLSELLGVTNTSFSHIMSKRMHASVEMMASLCLRFNISADWLLTGRGSMISETEGDTSLGQISMVLELIDTIKQQAEEIGQLKERISQLESERDAAKECVLEAEEETNIPEEIPDDVGCPLFINGGVQYRMAPFFQKNGAILPGERRSSLLKTLNEYTRIYNQCLTIKTKKQV